MGSLLQLALRLPRLAIVLFILVLVAIVGVIAYATYLAIGVAAFYLGTSRFVAGLLLGLLFARFPRMRQGKLHTVGLLPKGARPWVIMALLVLCSLHFLLRGENMPMLLTALAAVLPLTLQLMKKKLANRLSSFLMLRPRSGPASSAPPRRVDDTVIDAEFREKKD